MAVARGEGAIWVHDWHSFRIVATRRYLEPISGRLEPGTGGVRRRAHTRAPLLGRAATQVHLRAIRFK